MKLKNRKETPMSENIVAVSLFSGAGGLDIASFMAGVPVIYSTEFDADCIATLRANEDIFGKTEIFEGDLHHPETKRQKNDIGWRNHRCQYSFVAAAPK